MPQCRSSRIGSARPGPRSIYLLAVPEIQDGRPCPRARMERRACPRANLPLSAGPPLWSCWNVGSAGGPGACVGCANCSLARSSRSEEFRRL